MTQHQQPLKSKNQVIDSAIQLLLCHHPSTNQVLTRKSALTATFQYLTRDVPENSPEKASRIIVNYVRTCLIQ